MIWEETGVKGERAGRHLVQVYLDHLGGLDVPTEVLDTPVVHYVDRPLLLLVVGDGVIPKGAPYILCHLVFLSKILEAFLDSS